MKVVLVLSVVFALFQVGKSDLSVEISEAVTECATKQKLDKKTVASIQNDLAIPEDNEEYNEFFGCFSTALGTMDADGNPVEDRLKEVLEELLKKRLGDTIPDINAKVKHIIATAFDKCKDTPKGHCVGQSAVKLRNCLKAEVQKTQTH